VQDDTTTRKTRFRLEKQWSSGFDHLVIMTLSCVATDYFGKKNEKRCPFSIGFTLVMVSGNKTPLRKYKIPPI